MQLRNAKPVGIQHHHHRCVRHVDTHFNHGGCHQHIQFAVAKLVHRFFFFIRRHAPVQQPKPQTLQLFLAQAFEHLLGRRNFQLVALLNQRAHHKTLLPRRNRVAHFAPHHLFQQRPRRPLGNNRCSPWRQFVQHAHVQVAVHRHCCGARYGRCRHHQHIGRRCVGALLAKRRALLHTKPVLLVNHHHAQAGKLHPVLNQCVCTYKYVYLPAGQIAQQLLSPVACYPACQQLHSQLPVAKQVVWVWHLQPVKQPRHTNKMLLGQHFGWRHQRTLVPALHRRQHCSHRNHRLSASHIALQQPVHWVRALKVGFYFTNHSRLCRRERKRQRRNKSFLQFATNLMTNARAVALERTLARHQHQLHAQQFVKRQSFARVVFPRQRVGQVYAPQRSGSIYKPIGFAHLLRHRVEQPAHLASLQCVFYPSRQLPRAHIRLFALRVNRHNAPRAVANQINNRVRHLQRALVHVGLAKHGHVQPLIHLLCPPWLIEKCCGQPARAVAHRHRHHGAPTLHRPLAHAAHFHQHQRFLPRHQVAHSRLCGAVYPSPRVRGQQLQHVVDTKFVQRSLALFSYAFEDLYIQPLKFAQRDWLGHAPPRLFNAKQKWVQRLPACMHFNFYIWVILRQVRNHFFNLS